ncbi:MAG TPA: hypothetical protein VG796_29540 [Verrucomicrobiales bacterium]|nr:hypothetical protein [Verrucomicrobiales bacterium]
MSDRSAIYAARPEDAAEVQRVLRICLCGMRPPSALTFSGGDFKGWVRDIFMPVLAPHAVAVHGMAARGDAAALITADSALQLPPASALAGQALLAQRGGARFLPVVRRFMTAVTEGKAPGNFVTVLALHAMDFSIALLPLVQCLLYCEWRAGSPAGGTMEDFFRDAAGDVPSLPSLLVVAHPQVPQLQCLPPGGRRHSREGRR